MFESSMHQAFEGGALDIRIRDIFVEVGFPLRKLTVAAFKALTILPTTDQR
jgi:hypothetical protein